MRYIHFAEKPTIFSILIIALSELKSLKYELSGVGTMC